MPRSEAADARRAKRKRKQKKGGNDPADDTAVPLEEAKASLDAALAQIGVKHAAKNESSADEDGESSGDDMHARNASLQDRLDALDSKGDFEGGQNQWEAKEAAPAEQAAPDGPSSEDFKLDFIAFGDAPVAPGVADTGANGEFGTAGTHAALTTNLWQAKMRRNYTRTTGRGRR